MKKKPIDIQILKSDAGIFETRFVEKKKVLLNLIKVTFNVTLQKARITHAQEKKIFNVRKFHLFIIEKLFK